MYFRKHRENFLLQKNLIPILVQVPKKFSLFGGESGSTLTNHMNPWYPDMYLCMDVHVHNVHACVHVSYFVDQC